MGELILFQLLSFSVLAVTYREQVNPCLYFFFYDVYLDMQKRHTYLVYPEFKSDLLSDFVVLVLWRNRIVLCLACQTLG